MRLGRSGLLGILNNHVVELRFRRRIQKPQFPPHRRMLCTNDFTLLRSTPGQKILNFKEPTGELKYDPSQKNLVITWDIFLQNWRAVSCESVDVIAIIKTQPPKQFWDYFMRSIYKMPGDRKLDFIQK